MSVSIVDPQSRSCYYEELVAGRTLEVEFDVFRGGNMDITFFIRAPNGEVSSIPVAIATVGLCKPI